MPSALYIYNNETVGKLLIEANCECGDVDYGLLLGY